MIRPSSSTDARTRWLREYQKARNSMHSLFRQPGGLVSLALRAMPMRMRGRSGFGHYAYLVPTKPVGAPLAAMLADKEWPTHYRYWTLRRMRAEQEARHSGNWTRPALP